MLSHIWLFPLPLPSPTFCSCIFILPSEKKLVPTVSLLSCRLTSPRYVRVCVSKERDQCLTVSSATTIAHVHVLRHFKLAVLAYSIWWHSKTVSPESHLCKHVLFCKWGRFQSSAWSIIAIDLVTNTSLKHGNLISFNCLAISSLKHTRAIRLRTWMFQGSNISTCSKGGDAKKSEQTRVDLIFFSDKDHAATVAVCRSQPS